MASVRRMVTRRQFLRGAGALAVGGMAAWSFGIEPQRTVLRDVTVEAPSLAGTAAPLRIAVLTDLHVGAPYVGLDEVRRLVDWTNSLVPDAVVLLGDFLSDGTGNALEGVVLGRYVPPGPIAAELGRLEAPLGVTAVLGNHDWYHDGDEMRRKLEGVGITVLENEAHPVETPAGRLWFAGLADAGTRTARPAPTVDLVPKSEPVVVLTHDPVLFPDIPRRTALILAGHTHGGQVSLPLLGAPMMPSPAPRRHAHGLIREDGRTMYVSAGIGTSLLPVRFNMPPELTLVTLRAPGAA